MRRIFFINYYALILGVKIEMLSGVKYKLAAWR